MQKSSHYFWIPCDKSRFMYVTYLCFRKKILSKGTSFDHNFQSVLCQQRKYFCRQVFPLPSRTQLMKLAIMLKAISSRVVKVPKKYDLNWTSVHLCNTQLFSNIPWSFLSWDLWFCLQDMLISYLTLSTILIHHLGVSFTQNSLTPKCPDYAFMFFFSTLPIAIVTFNYGDLLGAYLSLFLLSSVKEELCYFAHQVSLITSPATSTGWCLTYAFE